MDAKLKIRESLLVSPAAASIGPGAGIGRTEGGYVKFKIRHRITLDGGKTRLATVCIDTKLR